MRFVDDEGRTWTVRDVALLPERTLVEPGHAQAVERYFVNSLDEKRLYHFAEEETRCRARSSWSISCAPRSRSRRSARVIPTSTESDRGVRHRPSASLWTWH